jgi:hypothetical protein
MRERASRRCGRNTATRHRARPIAARPRQARRTIRQILEAVEPLGAVVADLDGAMRPAPA